MQIPPGYIYLFLGVFFTFLMGVLAWLDQNRETPGQGSMGRVLRLLAIVPVLFFSVGGYHIYHYKAQMQLVSWLKEHGQRVNATIISIEESHRIRMNSRSPWIITATWLNPKDQKTYVFESPAMWFDPHTRLASSTIPVVLDPEDPSRYFMDLTPLYYAHPGQMAHQQEQLRKEVRELKKEVSDLKKKSNP